MKRGRQNVLAFIATLLLLLVAAAALLAFQSGLVGGGQIMTPEPVLITNLALDVRLSYDPAIFAPAEFDRRAEYPLQLNGDNWGFYGKRIGGLGLMLAREPMAQHYDFVGSQHVEAFEQWYKLEPLGEPVYEDAYINGQLALHQTMVYQRTKSSLGWPSYFPVAITDMESKISASIREVRTGSHIQDRLTADTGVTTAYIEGWALFTDLDLFFFQAISIEPLTAQQRTACISIMESLKFNALLGPSATAPSAAADPSSGGATAPATPENGATPAAPTDGDQPE